MIRTALLESAVYTVPTNAAAVDVSGIATTKGEATLVVEILSLVGQVRVSIQASSDAYATIADEIAFSIEGPLVNSPVRLSWMLPRDAPNYPLNGAGMNCRVALTRITGAGATVTLRSWVEHA